MSNDIPLTPGEHMSDLIERLIAIADGADLREDQQEELRQAAARIKELEAERDAIEAQTKAATYEKCASWLDVAPCHWTPEECAAALRRLVLNPSEERRFPGVPDRLHYRKCQIEGCDYKEVRGSREGDFIKGQFVCPDHFLALYDEPSEERNG